jgi:hypothetical protein
MRHPQLVIAAALLLTLGAACPGDIPANVPDGAWGGEHVGMVVTDTGATLEYDCAAGTITEPLRLASDGSFAWSGVQYPGTGGPVPVGVPPTGYPARYTGSATSTHMTLTVTVPSLASAPQTYTLVRGGNAKVFKCL